LQRWVVVCRRRSQLFQLLPNSQVLTMYCPSSPVSLEAQRLISVSIGKINASRITRTGTSLHKSLLVASVLHKARNVYLDEEREKALRFSHCLPIPPQVTVTPVSPPLPPPSSAPHVDSPSNNTVETDKENSISTECGLENNVSTADDVENRLPSSDANTGNNITRTTTTTTTVTSISSTSTITTTSSSLSSKKRRRISDQETEAAVSSILPKRLRTDNQCLEEEIDKPESTRTEEDIPSSDEETRIPAEETIIPEESRIPENKEELNVSGEESDSDSEDSASDTSTSSGSGDEMEVDKLTSLVSYFSFSKSQQQSEYCLEPLHSSGLLAITA